MQLNGIHGNLQERDLTELADMCANVARNYSADDRQSETAHVLRVEWVRLYLKSFDNKTEAHQESLRTRMLEFLSDVPAWMASGT